MISICIHVFVYIYIHIYISIYCLYVLVYWKDEYLCTCIHGNACTYTYAHLHTMSYAIFKGRLP